MKLLRAIVESPYEPNDTNVLWVDTSIDGVPTLRKYSNGFWTYVSSAGTSFIVNVDTLPVASKQTLGKMYATPSENPHTGDTTDEWLTVVSYDADGIPSYSWEQIGQNPDLSQFITKSVDNLENYYLKSETYTQQEITDRINASKNMVYLVVDELPEASSSTLNTIYLVEDAQQENVYNMYITQYASDTYSWVNIGNTSIDLSLYATEAELATLQAEVDGVKDDLEELDNKKANKDGAYDQMQVGLAKNLVGRTLVTDSFFERTTGGNAEVANGLAQIMEAGGNSVKWNQLLKTTGSRIISDPPFTLSFNSTINAYSISDGVASSGSLFYMNPAANFLEENLYKNHKILYIYKVVSGTANGTTTLYQSANSIVIINDLSKSTSIIFTSNTDYYPIFSFASGTEFSNFAFSLAIIDLTALEYPNIATTTPTVAEAEAWIAQKVGALPYYPYTAGTVLNNCMEGIETIGRNLLDPTTGKAIIVGAYSEVYGNYYGITGTYGTITFTDAYGNESTITPDSDGKFLLEVPGELSVASAGADCAVFLWWDGTQTDYSEHSVDVANLDITHIYGRKNGAGDRVQVWPTGAPGLGDLRDMLRIEGDEVVARRVMQEVDLGTLAWIISSTGQFSSNVSAKKQGNWNLVCAKYTTYNGVFYFSTAPDKSIGAQNTANTVIYVYDTSYSSAATFKTAMSGVMLYYELATPEVYTDLVYQGSSYFADGTPVTLPVNFEVDNWGLERVIPQNTSSAVVASAPVLTNKYSIDAVEELDTQKTENAYNFEQVEIKKADKNGVYDNMSVGSAKTLVGDTSSFAEYMFRKVPDEAATGNAFLMSLKGNSLVWNQLASLPIPATTTNYTLTRENGYNKLIVNNGNTKITCSLISFTDCVAGHKYYLTPNANLDGSASTFDVIYYLGNNSAQSFTSKSGVIVIGGADSNTWSAYIRLKADAEFELKFNFQLFDLTLMFGAGNEPSTVEEFESIFPNPYYACNAGQIINNKADAIESVGFNQWDEEWESGTYNTTTGEKSSNADVVRCKNYIPVVGGSTYYFKNGGISGDDYYIWGLLFDSSKTLIAAPFGSTNFFACNNRSLTLPANAAYLVFYVVGTTTYNHDICINLSDASKNGTYEPYQKNTLTLDITSLTGKLNGEGESVVIAPDGLKSACSVYDEGIVENGYLTKIVKRIGVVDLGTLTGWSYAESSATGDTFFTNIGTLNAKNKNSEVLLFSAKYIGVTASSLYDSNKTIDRIIAIEDGTILRLHDSTHSTTPSSQDNWLDGVGMNYQLAEPVTYILDTPLLVQYKVESGGTEMVVPQGVDTNGVPKTTPFVCDVKYSVDVVGFINHAPQNYQSKESDDSLLAAINSALSNGVITKEWDFTNGKYVYTFTPSVEPEPQPDNDNQENS